MPNPFGDEAVQSANPFGDAPAVTPQVAIKKAAPEVPKEEPGFLTHLKKRLMQEVFQPGGETFETQKDPVTGRISIKKPDPNAPSPTLELGRSMDLPAAVSVGTKAAELTPGGLIPKAVVGTGVGAASYIGLDRLFQKATGAPETLSDSAKNAGIQFVLGKTGEAVGSRLKGAYKALLEGYRGNPLEDQLGATGAQRTGSNTLKFLEDTLAGPAKQEALDASGAKAKELGGQTAAKLAGTKPEVISDPVARAALLHNEVAANYRKSQLMSGTLGDVARSRAGLHPTEVTVGYTPGNVIDPATNKAVMNPVQETVHGPIPVNNVYVWADQIIKKFPNPNLLVSPDDKAAYSLANNIIQKTAVSDAEGNQIATRPLSFGDAWDFKQEADKQYGNRAFSGLSDAFNKDIETGISQWDAGKGDPLALKAFNASKKETQRRITTFNDDDSISALLKSNDDTANRRAADALLQDPARIQRFLTTQSGGGNGNVRKLLQGADLANVIDESFSPASGTFDADKLTNKWLDPDRMAARKLIYGEEGAKNVSLILDAIKNVSDKEGTIGKTATKFRIVNGAINLSGALLSGASIASGHHITGAAIVGASIPLQALAKLSVSKEYAPLVAKMITGEPLGVSEQFAAKLILNGMAGSPIRLLLQDNSSKNGTVTKGGNIDLGGGK